MNSKLVNLILDNDINTIIFDFDGVLVESNNIKMDAFRKMYEPYGEKIVNQVMLHHKKFEGVSRFVKFDYYHREFLNHDLTSNELDNLCNQFSSIVKEQVILSPSVNGAISFIEYCLAMNKKLFVVSGTPQEELQEIILKRGWSSYFKKVYGSPFQKSKAIAEILRENQVIPANALMVGDAMLDFEAAEHNKILFCGRITAQNKKTLGAQTYALKISDYLTEETEA